MTDKDKMFTRKNPYILCLSSITGLFSALVLPGCTPKQTTHPNVLYVFPDQFRNHALEFWGEAPFDTVGILNDPVHTPNLNRFAIEAVTLTSAQSNCPLSSPHRGIMLTGMYPDGSGVTLNCNATRPISSLRPDVTTISDVLSQNGYDCAYIGKLHVDFPTPNDPENPGHYVESQVPAWDAYTPPERRHGFNYWYSYGTFDVHKSPHYWDTEGKRHEIREWSPEHEADKAIDYLKNRRDPGKPFFLMVAMNPPHSPYRTLDDVMEQDYNLYKDKPLDSLLVRPNVNPELTDKQACAPYYFASVTGVDRAFGRILQALEELGLDKNTIVVFTSDHGETMASHVTDPKNSPYTESMNVPFMIRYPDKLKPHINDVLLSSPDIMPTILSLAGLKGQIPATVQGQDLADCLRGTADPATLPTGVLYLRNLDGNKDEQGLVTDYFAETRGIKTERYTLALTLDRKGKLKSTLFFDEQNDPFQMDNINPEKQPEVFADLCRQMAVLLKKADDPWYRNRTLDGIIPYE